MTIEFEQSYLKDLYESGKCNDKKHRFQPNIIAKYKKCIDILVSADKVEDLFVFRSLNYEVLKGDKNGISSIRVNDQYRIEFKVEQLNSNKPVITICKILELSNHYK